MKTTQRGTTLKDPISTISANLRQPPRPIATRPSLPTPSPTQTPTPPPESLVDRLPRSKASVNHRSKYFF